MENIVEQRRERTTWFLQDRFGLFIHWGLYAIPARGEWVRSMEKITVEDYQPFFDGFNPKRYDPRAWARMAREAGMRYAVLTTKHHDGFCLFDSQLTDYKATCTPAGRDLVREYVEAFRAEGLKVGFYYSLLDWHHPDYPHYGQSFHPMRENEAFKGAKHDFNRYVDYLHGQVRELLTKYGKIDILWFDFSYDDMTGEKWRATELVKMARELQPGLIIDNRLGGHVAAAEPESYSGDFASPEQIIPPAGMKDDLGRPLPWEACITQNGTWGYNAKDTEFLSARQTIRSLVNCVSKGGNLLINAGPTANGEIPAKQQKVLAEVGEWLRLNGESIYGAGEAEFPKPEWGRLTQKGNRLFCHIQEPGMGTLSMPGMRKKLRNPRWLETGAALEANAWHEQQHLEDVIICLPRQEFALDPVIEWEIVP